MDILKWKIAIYSNFYMGIWKLLQKYNLNKKLTNLVLQRILAHFLHFFKVKLVATFRGLISP